MSPHRAGIVAVVGRPNVGKSSLVNAIVGSKVSIVSDKPQTTRFTVRGVASTPGYQIVFVDTPGYHKPRTALGDRLNRAVEEGVAGVDAVALVVDAAAGVGRGDAFVAEREVVPFTGPKLCAVNKIDRITHAKLVPQLAAAAELAPFDHVVPVSARSQSGLSELLVELLAALPEGPALFPEDLVTDMSVELRAAEIIREKALALTKEEVPHSVAVQVDSVELVEETGLTRVGFAILVERESQKGILIGKGGSMAKSIGSRARQELEDLFGTKVFVELRVKVMKEWQRDPAALDRLGY